jgi:PAS domain S-box-containing protein
VNRGEITAQTALDFRAIAEAIPEMVWTALPDGEIDYANGQIHAYAGLAREARPGWRWDGVAHPDDLPKLLAAWRRAVEDGEPFEAETRLRRADGFYRWFIVRASAMREPDGTVTRWFGTCTDIDHLHAAAARNAFLARADELFAVELDARAIMRAVARAAVASFADYVLFDLVGDDGVLRRAAVEHRDPRRRGPFQRSVGQVPPLDHPVHPIAAAWRSGESVLVPRIDATWWERAAADPAHLQRMRDEDLSSLITVVIEARGRCYGVLTFCRTGTSEPYGDGDLATAEDLARRIGAALENARLFGEARAAADVQRRIAEREAFYARLGEAVAETLDLRETLDAATALLVPQFADWAVVNLIDENGELYLASSHHRDAERDASLRELLDVRYVVADAATGSREVVRTKRAVVYEQMPDGGAGAVSAPYRETIADLAVCSAIVAPIAFGGVVRGTLAMMYDRTSRRNYAGSELPFFAEVARRLSPAIGNAEAYERERRVARTFQAAALTTELPRIAGISFDALYEAGRSEALIGGDWYDAFRVADGRVVV